MWTKGKLGREREKKGVELVDRVCCSTYCKQYKQNSYVFHPLSSQPHPPLHSPHAPLSPPPYPPLPPIPHLHLCQFLPSLLVGTLLLLQCLTEVTCSANLLIQTGTYLCKLCRTDLVTYLRMQACTSTHTRAHTHTHTHTYLLLQCLFASPEVIPLIFHSLQFLLQ